MTVTPGCTTGVEITAAAHWLRMTRLRDAQAREVADRLAGRFGWDVVALDGGALGYVAQFRVGPLRVFHHPERAEMGVCVEVCGEACEAVGPAGVAWLLSWGWKVTRLDVAVDGCPFTPADVREAWMAGQVRTLVKVPKDAREDRAWRKCRWEEDPTGDVFRMGSRTSTQYGRCYDRRGSTRFELELKREAAEAAAAVLGALLAEGDEVAFGEAAVGLLRRFVDFVDRTAAENVTRAPLLSWWAAFVKEAPRVRLWLGGRVARSAAEMLEWALAQAAPVLAVIERVFGPVTLRDMVADGRSRWRGRHHEALRMAGVAAGAA